jgi:hypothetical protein
MDGHRDADADIESIDNRYIPHPSLLRKERKNCGSHCERYGGMRGGPAPEYPAAQEPEPENMTQIRANCVRGGSKGIWAL